MAWGDDAIVATRSYRTGEGARSSAPSPARRRSTQAAIVNHVRRAQREPQMAWGGDAIVVRHPFVRGRARAAAHPPQRGIVPRAHVQHDRRRPRLRALPRAVVGGGAGGAHTPARGVWAAHARISAPTYPLPPARARGFAPPPNGTGAACAAKHAAASEEKRSAAGSIVCGACGVERRRGRVSQRIGGCFWVRRTLEGV